MANQPTNVEKTPTNKNGKKIGLIVLVVIILILFQALRTDEARRKSVENADWKIISTQSYVRDGQECKGYRVYLPSELWNDTDMGIVYRKVTDDDYYMHIVWFYRIESYANGTHEADAIMEEVQPGVTPSIQK